MMMAQLTRPNKSWPLEIETLETRLRSITINSLRLIYVQVR